MTEAIVNYLNLKLETVGRLGVIHCLAELRSDGTTTVPYVYSGTGQVVPINIDGGNLSYWRMDNPISFEPIVGKYGVNQMSGTYDLRLVVVARRKDSTVDDAFMPTRLAEDIANQITGSFPDLKLLLKAQSVSIRVNSIDTNIPKIWGEEFTGTQVNDLNYTRAIMALSVSVTVIGSRDCWQNECDIDPNILHIFDFCNPNVVAELTPTQVACLEDALCEPCLDGNIELNGVQVATVASGGTEDILVLSEGSNPVGSLIGSDWVIENNATTINGVQVTDQEAEQDAAIFVTRDGVQNGTWNAGIQTWEVTSAACSPVTFQINAVNKESITSGTTFNLITKLDGAVNSGTYDAPTDTLSFTSAACSPVALQINGTPQESIAAGATFNLIATLDGVAGGTYNAATDTLAFTSTGGWVRPSNWRTLPTLTAASEAGYILLFVYENRLNQFTLQIPNGTVDWGDGTTSAASGAVRTKTYIYSSIAQTVFVDPITGENYKQVIIGITRLGAAITTVDFTASAATSPLNAPSYAVDYNLSFPNCTDFRVSNASARDARFAKILKIWALGTLGGICRIGNTSNLRILQLPTTFSGSFSGNFGRGMGAVPVGNINTGTAINCQSLFYLSNIISHGNLTANSTVLLNYYASESFGLETFGTVTANACTNIEFAWYNCTGLTSIGLLTLPICTSYFAAFYNTQLTAIRFADSTTCTNTASMIGLCPALQLLHCPNLTRGVNFTGTSIGNYGMNIFASGDGVLNGIGTASGAQTITITGTPYGALVTAADATALAIRAVMTGKGYTIAN
jgi:hypothetical protein